MGRLHSGEKLWVFSELHRFLRQVVTPMRRTSGAICCLSTACDDVVRAQVIDRILYKLDELVRPFVHKILVVIEPLLIDEDYYARVEGREIIANLSKAAGLATMIAAMRPDIDNIDECASPLSMPRLQAPAGRRSMTCAKGRASLCKA